MAARLILNADDFGLTRGVNRAILELHRAGAITSTTLMANGAALDDAVRIARENPSLSVGCHIVLTDGVPLSRLEQIPTLLDGDGKSFRPSLIAFFLAAVTGRINPNEVALEAQAQIERLQDAGIRVTHADTHKHTHILPQIARPILLACERTGVQAIRNPFEQPWSMGIARASVLRTLQLRLLQPLRRRFEHLPAIHDRHVLTTDGTVGISATGHLNHRTLLSMLEAAPDGLWEIVCHPGYNDGDLDQVTTRLRVERETEREALLQLLPATAERLELVSFGPNMHAR